MPPKFRVHELELPARTAGERFDVALAAALPQYSRARLQRWISSGEVLLAGRKVLPRQRLAGGEQVRVRAEYAVDERVGPEAIALNVVFEDEALLVIDKPAGLMCILPAIRTLQTHCWPTMLRSRWCRAGLIHRLDKDTSGLAVRRAPRRPSDARAMLQRAISSAAIRRWSAADRRGHD